MKKTLFASVFVSISLAGFAHSNWASAENNNLENLPITSLEKVVCSASNAPVFSDDLKRATFEVARYERVNLAQGWGEIRKVMQENGEAVTFVKAQFPDRESEQGNAGWIRESSVVARSDCQGADTADEDLRLASASQVGTLGLSTSCCTFPMKYRASADYTSGMRAFGSNRSGGKRKHAACDLYRAKNDPILAVTEGTVLRSNYYFYQGTYAVEVKHSGGFVVRYGEVNSKVAAGKGKRVSAGQTVGYMGKTSCCTPMLHFELYSGAKKGSLSQGGNKYRRRSDLLNPSKYLVRWEQNAFRDRL